MRPVFVTRVLMLAIVVGSAARCGVKDETGGRVPDPPRRVIMIAVDSLRTDHLGYAGYERDTSPWLDGLAAKSANFLWAISPANETVRSVASYFSGRPYSQIQSNMWATGIPEDIETLAELLHEHGFTNSMYTANANLIVRPGYGQGFDRVRFVSTPAKPASSIDEITETIAGDYKPTGGREFVYVHTMDVHHPYRPPAPYGSMFTERYERDAVREGGVYLDGGDRQVWSTLPYWSEEHDVQAEDIAFLRGLYDGAIRYTDGRLPALLEALSWDPDKDLLVITADHGEHLFEQGWWMHFATLTPMEVRVPLIVHYGGIPARRIDAPVSLLDLYPTIAAWYGLDPPKGTFGVSLLPALMGADPTEHAVLSEKAPRNGRGAAIVGDAYWYEFSSVRNYLKPWLRWPREDFLYAYREDPLASENRVDEEPAIADTLNGRLRAANPRWSAYTRDVLREDSGELSLGPDRLDDGCCPNSEAAVRSVADSEGGTTWRVDMTGMDLAFHAENLRPYEPYCLTLPYRLEQGRARLAFIPEDGGDVDWHYVFAKPTDGETTFQSTIVPSATSGTFAVTFESDTKAELGRPRLRRLVFDHVESWPRPPEAEGGLASDELTPQDRARLKALGYL